MRGSMGVGHGQKGLRGGGARREGVVAVGLTGGIGAGKSTALEAFARLGAVTISADGIVHQIYRSPVFAADLASHLGNEILDAAGKVDRGRLSDRVKGDVELLRWLERLTHPLVEREIVLTVENAPEGSVVVCEVPLLFEAGFDSLFDLVVTIETDRRERLARSSRRVDPAAFAEFDALQASGERRVSGSDMVFRNDGAIERLEAFVEEVYARAQSMSTLRGRGGLV